MLNKIIVYGISYEDCRRQRNDKMKRGWRPTGKIVFDPAFIGGRYAVVMQMEFEGKGETRPFNKFMGSV